jgi:hypothetical protein
LDARGALSSMTEAEAMAIAHFYFSECARYTVSSNNAVSQATELFEK